MTEVKSSTPMKRGVQLIGASGMTIARPIMGIAPKTICQAVSAIRSIGARCWIRLIMMAPTLQATPAPSASRLPRRLPCRCQGCTRPIRPSAASAIANHCKPRTRSPSSGQAKIRV